MAERNREQGSERRIYVGSKGHRYVKPDELLRDPKVKRRLESADRLADRLGLKGRPEDDTPAA